MFRRCYFIAQRSYGVIFDRYFVTCYWSLLLNVIDHFTGENLKTVKKSVASDLLFECYAIVFIFLQIGCSRSSFSGSISNDFLKFNNTKIETNIFYINVCHSRGGLNSFIKQLPYLLRVFEILLAYLKLKEMHLSQYWIHLYLDPEFCSKIL